MVVPKPSNRKVNCSISTKAMPRRQCSVLIKTDVTFWKTKLHVKNNRHWKHFVGQQMKSDPSITIRSETTNRLVEPTRWPLMTQPLALPLNPLPPPERSNKVWKRRKTAHLWRTVSSPPAKKDDEMPIRANSGNEIDSATLNEQDYKISLISLHREIQSFHSDHGEKEYTTLLDNLIIKTLELIERSELYLQPQPLPPPPRPQ